MRTRTIFLLTLLTIALHIYCAGIVFITPDGSGTRDGSSWVNSAGNAELQDILFENNGKDIWISKGVYKPTYTLHNPESERDKSFFIFKNDVYGGFAGIETELSQRDIKANETIFSGDIGIEGDNSDNCYHVINAGSIIIDGLTICDGNANGSLYYNSNNCGGAVFVENIWQDFRNCTFRDNHASNWGGAAYVEGWGSYITFENCLFYNNESYEGGAIYSSYTTTIITNCTFVKNTTEYGGCVSVPYRSNDEVLISNNIFWNNTGDDLGYPPNIYSVSHNALEGGYAGITNINLSSNNTGEAYSPYFTDPDNHDYSLQSVSPLIDAGVYWNVSCETDITGSLRPQGTGWDIGAYEYNSGPLTSVPPSVSTLSPEYTTLSTARVRGNVTDDGGAQMITKGVYYSITPGFDPVDSTLIRYDQLYNEGEFHIDITNLPANTTYYYRIFCENRIGTAVGEEMSFTTDSGISPDANGILYAKPDGNGDGSSWANAIHGNDLQLGIDHADVTEVWLAAGKYVPTSWPSGGSNERSKHFQLKPNSVVYGGFNGTETAVEQRDIKINKTVLSGDIGAEGEYYDNTFRVVNNGSRDIDYTAVIDGVTISDANGDGSYGSGKGGGMFNSYCSPTIRNCTFENNRALYGGGIYNIDAFPTLINCAIVNNTALIAGGGLFNRNNYYFKTADDRAIELYHCTVAGNSAPQGSQITFAQESRSDDIYIKMYNSVIWGNEPEIFWCDIDNAHYMEETKRPSGSEIVFCGLSSPETGEGNILLSRNNTGDPNSPYFIDPESGDYSLQYDSACKDKAIYRYATEEDILGTVRPQGAAYDIGAYEFETSDPTGDIPVVVTGAADSITVTTAMCHTEILSNTGGTIAVRGIIVGLFDGFNPETQQRKYLIRREPEQNTFPSIVSQLEPNRHYFYRSYAENRIGYSYGQQESFVTRPYISADSEGIIYVKQQGSGQADGSSWENALHGNDLQAAIHHNTAQEVWVAEGTYKPNSWPSSKYINSSDYLEYEEKNRHFSLKAGVSLRGGFSGNEKSADQRDYKLNETILSGDLGIENDSTYRLNNIIFNYSDLRLIDGEMNWLPLIDSTAVIDGFTVSDGYNSRTQYSSLFLWGGAAIFNSQATPKIINCKFINNESQIFGGAINNYAIHGNEWEAALSELTIENCIFLNNSSKYGGAVYNSTYAKTILKNCDFSYNYSSYLGNALYARDYEIVIQNNLFYGNTYDTANSFALFLLDCKQVDILNTTIAGNSGGICFSPYYKNTFFMTNSIFYNNGDNSIFGYVFNTYLPDINNCAFDTEPDFEYTGSNNILLSSNNAGDPNSPYFSDPDRNHWWIQEASPLRNSGIWTDDVPLYDIVGNLRDDIPDIGCYEYDPSSIEESESVIPVTTKLYQNYPNPFNPTTNIRFSIAKAGKVELIVYNVLGQVVEKLVESDFKAGHHSVVFNADALNSGVYYYTLEVDGKKLTKRMLMVK